MEAFVFIFLGFFAWVIYRCCHSPFFTFLCGVIALIIWLFTDPDALLTIAIIAGLLLILTPFYLIIKHLNDKDKIEDENVKIDKRP